MVNLESARRIGSRGARYAAQGTIQQVIMSKIAVIAGSGNLPFRVIDKLRSDEIPHVVLSIEGYGPVGG